MKPGVVYLDNSASAPIDPSAAETLRRTELELAANPASVHSGGVRAALAVERARTQIASRIGCAADELVFTSGGTESNNWAIKGALWAAAESGRDEIVISSVEHPSVLEPARWLAARKLARLIILPVTGEGLVSIEEARKAVSPRTALVSVMHANNEVGSIQPLAELCRVARDAGALFHTDACQSFLREDIDVHALGADLMTLNSHKIHGPKGVGALFVRRGLKIEPLQHGGGHENGLRSGTLNTAGIAAFGEAVSLFRREESRRIAALRDRLILALTEAFPALVIHGPVGRRRQAGNVNFRIPGFQGRRLFDELNRRDILVSTSSACHSARNTPSHVLKAMGASDEEAHESIRVSLGRFNSERDLDALVEALLEITREEGLHDSD